MFGSLMKCTFYRKQSNPDGMGGYTGSELPLTEAACIVQQGRTSFGARGGVGQEEMVDATLFMMSAALANQVQIGDTVEVDRIGFKGTITHKNALDKTLGATEA